ncbi:hypothetical protein [Klebsiella phage vB_KpnM_TU02]|nr:hypothetical protein [Klebsiella phage vB_KpnM_TU02]
MEPSRKQESIGFISSFGSLRLLPERLSCSSAGQVNFRSVSQKTLSTSTHN